MYIVLPFNSSLFRVSKFWNIFSYSLDICSVFQVYDLQFKKCKEILSDFSNIPINPNERDQCYGTTVNIVNTVVHFPTCPENYNLIRLLNHAEEDTCEQFDFLTYFNNKDQWVVVDSRGRRDSRKAHYGDFCIDRVYNGNRHMGNIALFCEQPEESYCQENACFHHCCPLQHYFDEQKMECIYLDYEAFYDWTDEFDAKKPDERIEFENITNIYENLGVNDLQCEETFIGSKYRPNDTGIIVVNLTEQDVKFLSNGQLDIDGAIIPFNKHCYNLQGELIIFPCIFFVFHNR